jgi:RNA polymerase sigma factor (sigma-70 family)
MANASLGMALRHLRGLVQTQTTEALSDGQLLERFIATGEEAAFAALLRRHGPMVLSVCRRVLGHAHDAEDVLQATFLLLARKGESIHRGESVSSWLHSVAFRLAVKARAQATTRRQREQEAAARRQPGSGLKAAWRELEAALDEELQRLPAKYRAPLVLCYLEGKTQEEAAHQIGCPLGTVRSRLARARQLLRERLRRQGVALSAGALATALAADAPAATLPAPLFHATLRVGRHLVAGQAIAGGVSAQTAAWVEEGLPGMPLTKGKVGLVLFLLGGLIATAALILTFGALARSAGATHSDKTP